MSWHRLKNILNTDKAFCLYLLFVFLYQFFQTFVYLNELDCGICLSQSMCIGECGADSGMSLSWWFSFLANKEILSVFSGVSVWKLRVLHVFFNLLTVSVVYLYFKRYVPKKYLLAGLFLCSVVHYGIPNEMSYTQYTVFLFMLATILFAEGILNRRYTLIVVAALLSVIAVPFRIVNVSFVGIAFVPVLLQVIGKNDRGYGVALKDAVVFLSAYVACMLCMLFVMSRFSIGKNFLDAFVSAFVTVLAPSSEVHSSSSIVYSYLKNVGSMLVLGLCYGGLAYAQKYFKNKRSSKLFSIVIFVGLLLAVAFVQRPVHWLVAFLYFGMICVILGLNDRKFLLLASLFFYTPIVLPLGSVGGHRFYGINFLYMSLPIVWGCLLQAKSEYREGSFMPSKKFVALLCSAILIGTIIANVRDTSYQHYPFWHNRYEINSPVVGPVRVSKAQSEELNSLIENTKPYLVKGDYLVSDISPLMSPLLQCRSLGVVYEASEQEFDSFVKGLNCAGRLPYFLLKKQYNVDGICGRCFSYVKQRYSVSCVWEDSKYMLFKVDE